MMTLNRVMLALCSTSILIGSMLPIMEASALEIRRVRCEARADRSKVDVDARGVAAGSRHAVTITSGANAATQAQNADANGELDYRFDSNVEDENNLAGDFIQGSVTASIPGAASVTAACRMR